MLFWRSDVITSLDNSFWTIEERANAKYRWGIFMGVLVGGIIVEIINLI